MTRIATVFVVVMTAACGGSSGSSGDTTPQPGDTAVGPADGAPVEPVEEVPEEKIEYETIELPSASNVIPLLKVGAEGVGCTLVSEEADGLAYQCEDGLIFMVQKGATLRYACENTPKETCGALMQSITDKMIEAAGG
jgi:hypothetical protein